MSQRHTMVTSFLYENAEEREDIVELIEALKSHFQDVYPHWNDYGHLGWIMMFTRDSDGISSSINLREFLPQLEGILKGGFEIVAAWDGAPEDTQVVWPVRGRGSEMSRLDWIEAHS